MTTSEKARLAMLKVEQSAIRHGFITSIPTADEIYDCVLDTKKSLLRVQVKYGDGESSHSDGSIVVCLRHREGSNRLRWKPYGTEIDVVLAYLPKIDDVVWLDQKHFVGKNAIAIRLSPTRNGQSKGVIFVESVRWK
jgi:hypothetical protein